MSNDLPDIMEPTLWRKNGWTARVIKNEDDDGWAVEIRKAVLCAVDEDGQVVAKHKVAANYKFNRDVANEWVRGGFCAPG